MNPLPETVTRVEVDGVAGFFRELQRYEAEAESVASTVEQAR